MIERTLHDAIQIPISVASQDSVVHTNIGQEYIVTTADKVELCLTRHKSSLEDKRKWLIPFSALLSIASVIATTGFETRFGVEASVWQGVFWTLGGLLLVWTALWGYTAIKSPSPYDFISELTKANGVQEKEDRG